MSFTKSDIQQIEAKGLSIRDVESQITLFKSGIPFTNIAEAATIDNGILKLKNENIANSISHFEKEKNKLALLKFVPASGAATRMFKFLFQFVTDYNPKEESINSYINKNGLKDMSLFMDGLEKFPFYHQILEQLKLKGINFETLSDSEKVWHFAHAMLDENQLDFGNSPKGLLPFHEYKNNEVSTAFEEHLYEAALYASSDKNAKLHFTISEQFKNKFNSEFTRIKERIEHKTGVGFKEIRLWRGLQT